ncbi:hypothetical protein [uncultured Maribacter sp.]|uniref:hypothetical protein n=1 Tax=uncultured Maribacter sp. TaxID=431308 RepID=UPI00261C2436|nr:hypothetical protein [uncultured Maribacter sp.]
MRKIFLFSFMFLGVLSCKNKNMETTITKNDILVFDTSKWIKKAVVNAKASSIISSWSEYSAFDTSLDVLYESENLEDLAIGLEDLIEKQKLLLKSDYPEEYDVPQIKSRQKVVLTFMLKLKADLEYRLPVEEAVLEMLRANNAMRTQFNVEVNNPLDNSLIIEEEEN